MIASIGLVGFTKIEPQGDAFGSRDYTNFTGQQSKTQNKTANAARFSDGKAQVQPSTSFTPEV